jgi:hypothetical protein
LYKFAEGGGLTIYFNPCAPVLCPVPFGFVLEEEVSFPFQRMGKRKKLDGIMMTMTDEKGINEWKYRWRWTED